eukprot:16447604-Heterocapsa_arctica.AAC.1
MLIWRRPESRARAKDPLRQRRSTTWRLIDDQQIRWSLGRDYGFIDGEDTGALMVVKDRRTGTLANSDIQSEAIDDDGVKWKADRLVNSEVNSDQAVREVKRQVRAQ